MKEINLETELTLNGMALMYYELKDKNAEKGDLIKKDENKLGVILKADEYSIYVGNLDKDKKIPVTEFNGGTFAQFYITKESESYEDHKKIIEEVLSK